MFLNPYLELKALKAEFNIYDWAVDGYFQGLLEVAVLVNSHFDDELSL